jgi:hypothetical protein
MVKAGNYNHPELVVLPESEILRMKVLSAANQNNATVKSKEEELHDRKVAEEQRQQQLEMARAKKEKMLRIEEEKKRSVPPNEFEREELEKAQAINEKALEARKEELEDVKEMNKMVAYAKAVTIRDRQLQ